MDEDPPSDCCEAEGCTETENLEVKLIVSIAEGGDPHDPKNRVVLCPNDRFAAAQLTETSTDNR
jgi:hypothetical protein